MSRHDAVIAFSNSGETAELNDIILFASRHGIPITGVTKRGDSFLARHADYVLLLPNEAGSVPYRMRSHYVDDAPNGARRCYRPFPAQGKGLRRGGFPSVPSGGKAWQEAHDRTRDHARWGGSPLSVP